MQAYHLLFIAGALLLLTAPLLLAASRTAAMPKPAEPAPHQRPERQKADARDTEPRRRKRSSLQLDTWRQIRRDYESIDKIAKLLRQCGITSSADQVRYLIGGVIIALLFGLLAGTVVGAGPQSLSGAIVYGILAFVATLVLLKRLLKTRAQRRQLALDSESLMLIQTTRMLWRVGLSLPKTLSILCDELRHLTPHSAAELRIAVQRIETGQAQDDALQDLTSNTAAEGFREYLIILRQESMTGGGIDRALQELYETLQSRRKTRLQEKVSKTSANMSVVMMLFMFPSLIIVIGGPGYIAVSKALVSLNGG